MKSKKITAWLVLVAMLMSLMPTSLVFAAAPTNNPTPYPEIVTDVFSSMTIDADGVTSGTDLDLVNNSDKLPVIDTTPGSVVTSAAPVAGVDEGAYKGQDDKLTAVKRKQILTFVAKSQADLLSDRTFVDETGPMKIVPNAVEIAYMNEDKEPLVLDLNSKFNMTKATDWSTDGVWIDIAEDIQITDVVLETFLSTDQNGPTPLLDKRNGNILDKEKITAAQLFATDDMVSFMIYNVINGDFSGFLRVKITDKGGNTTVQDYPVVADGQYPVASIKTSTLKNPVGSDVAVTAENTFIPEMVFKTPVDTFVSETKMSYRHYEWTADDANTAEVDDGKTMLKKALAWQHPDYKSEEIWAMDEVVVDEIEISDLAVSSGVTSVTYDIKNFTLEENVDASSLEGSIPVAYDGATNTCDLTTNPIKITEEGFNVLAITVEDLAGLKTTCRYYFFIDTTPPEAKFEIVSLEKNVAELFTASDVVTNRQLAIGMEDSEDIKTSSLTVISGIRAKDEAGDPIFVAKEERYQYRLLARDYAIADADVDFSNVTDGIPYGYTATAPADTNLTYGKWLVWSGSIEEAVINEEFEGIIQVRVQDRAGNWSSIVSEASDGKETIITDNTNAGIEVNVYANDGDATTVDEIKTGVATNVLDDSDRNVDNAENTDKNETITTITGDTMPWISDSAVMAVKITDEDLINAIRSSGLEKGQITVNAEFNKKNQNKEIKIWKKDGSQPDTEDPGLIGNSVEFEIAKEHIFGDDDSTLDYNEADKALTFYLEYEGTGAVDITVSIKDQADVNDGDDFTVIYKTQLRVDKINP